MTEPELDAHEPDAHEPDAHEPGRLRWTDWRARWPQAAHSRFVTTPGLRWHVQRLGQGPTLLLLHGTGGATHSWAPMLPALARHCTVVAPDLPGHGFTTTPPAERLSLDGMAGDVAALLAALGDAPAIVAGHSAGVAVLLRLVLDGRLPAVRALVGFAPALAPPPGIAGSVLAPLLAPVARSGLAAQLAAQFAASGSVIARTLASTGSQLPDAQLELYAALAAAPAHAGAALTMMANWRLAPLVDALPQVALPVTLALGARDGWVPGAQVRTIARRLPDATLVELPEGGHLVHEEQPERAAALVLSAARAVGVLPPA